MFTCDFTLLYTGHIWSELIILFVDINRIALNHMSWLQYQTLLEPIKNFLFPYWPMPIVSSYKIRQLNQIYYILYNYKMKEYRIDQSTKSKGFKLFYVCFLQFIKSNKYAYILLCIFFYAYSFMNVLLCIFFYIYSSMYILLCIFFYVYSSMYILLCIFVYLFLYYLSNTEQCKSM